MSILVKIDRSSVVKNPDAGKTRTTILQGQRITFEYTGKELPEYLPDIDIMDLMNQPSRDYVVTELGNDGKKYSLRGRIFNSDCDFAKSMKKDRRAVMYMDNDFIHYDHLPLDKYLYKYENTQLKCEECGKIVNYDDIDQDCDDDSGYCYDECPVCHAHDSFGDIDLEKIEEVVKELAL